MSKNNVTSPKETSLTIKDFISESQNLTVESLEITEELFSHIVKKWIAGNVTDIRTFLQKIPKIAYKFGTKEWANKNFNTHNGCKHGCWNCYAWKDAYRYNQPYWITWDTKMTLRKNWSKTWRKSPDGYWIMYPSRHDTLLGMEPYAFRAIQNMLNANINVLFVSKGHYEVFDKLTKKFIRYTTGQPKMVPRVTLGTNSPEFLTFWEKKAPSYDERLACMKLAYLRDYEISWSCEPTYPAKELYNGNTAAENFLDFAKNVLEFVRGEAWFGLMNHFPVNTQRGKSLTRYQHFKVKELKEFYFPENIRTIIEGLYQDKRVHWKESIKKYVIEDILKSG